MCVPYCVKKASIQITDLSWQKCYTVCFCWHFGFTVPPSNHYSSNNCGSVCDQSSCPWQPCDDHQPADSGLLPRCDGASR